ncbi:MAG: ferredoxin [Pseudomonadota bacterium]|nr:ferredoxin [Deltaproteobacteria bacterium]
MNRKPFVDQDSCISCGLCVSTCPGVFRFNNSGKSEVYCPDGDSEQQIQQAIDGCPVQCISWK